MTFEEGAIAYDHNDAGGFIQLNALRLEHFQLIPDRIRKRRRSLRILSA